MAEKKAFWSSLPGVLTGFGSLVVAITGLVAALNSIGVIGSKQQQKNAVFSSDAQTRPGIQVSGDLSGKWRATVKYDWGAIHTENFVFRDERNEISGTASFLGVPRGVRGGKRNEEKIAFITKTQEIAGSGESKEVIHHYQGTISGDEIRFNMQTEGGYSERIPVHFIAKKIPHSDDEK